MPQSRSRADADPGPAPSAVTDRLFPAALRAFAEQDFHAVGMRDICASSGVSTATVYRYYRSKEALLFAILRSELAAIDADLRAAVAAPGPHEGKWRDCFDVLMRRYDEKPDLATAYFITVPTRTWISDGGWASFGSAEALQALAAEGQRTGALDPAVSTSMTTSLVFMLCAREVQLWYHHGRRWRLRDRAGRMAALFWRAVGLPGQAPSGRHRRPRR